MLSFLIHWDLISIMIQVIVKYIIRFLEHACYHKLAAIKLRNQRKILSEPVD